MVNELMETLKYSWLGILGTIMGGLLAFIGGKTYASANKIVETKLCEYVKKEDYKEDMTELKDNLKEVKEDIKELLKKGG